MLSARLACHRSQDGDGEMLEDEPSVAHQSQAAAGELLFARYAYPPNELGYCGPGDGQALLDLAAGVGEDDVGTRARLFEGAWPYLEIIASSAGIGNPLDARVVEAYWVGNELLEVVNPAYFAQAARRRFAAQPGADWASLDRVHQWPAVPHHSFHVLTVYPWMGVIREGRGGPALSILDRCRIRWGRVTSVHGDQVDVSCQPLSWDGAVLGLGEERAETVRWAQSGRSLSSAVEPGEWVSLHWDWVCDKLTSSQLDALRNFTDRQLAITNGPRSPAAGFV